MTTIYNNKYDIDGEATNDQSGYSVSMNSSGDIVAIGSISAVTNANGKTGHVRVYKQIDGAWKQLGIDIDGEAADDKSGYSISMNSAGDIVAIGAVSAINGSNAKTGHVRVYQYIDTPDGPKPKAWIQLSQDIDGEAAGDQSGHSVSMNSAGDIVAIGAIFNNGDGHVRVHQYNGSSWSILGDDINGAKNTQAGYSVSMNSVGDIVAVGGIASSINATRSGQVVVYQYNARDNKWENMGQDINGDDTDDRSGSSVSMNSVGDIVAIGAYFATNDYEYAGRVRIYQYNDRNNKWETMGQDINGAGKHNFTGDAVSMNSAGDIVAIGSRVNDDDSLNSGHVRVWKYNGFLWDLLGLVIYGEATNDKSGYSVSMNSSGDIVAIGAINATGNDGDDLKSGHTRVFYYRNNAWNQAPPGFFKVSDTGVFTISGTGLFTVQ
jgi:hypothetical protein